MRKFKIAAFIVGGLLGSFAIAWGANNAIQVLGAGGAGPFALCAYDVGGSPDVQAYCVVNTDKAGNAIYTTDATANQLVVCNQEALYDTNTSGKTQMVALSAGKKIYVCGFHFVAAGTVSVDLTQGTGSNCASGTNTKMTPTYQLTAQTGLLDPSTIGPSVGSNVSIVSQELCIETNAGIAVQAIVKYAQF